MTTDPRHWWVVSPVMSVVVPILDDGSGPTEHYCDVVCVEAATKREALRLGVGLMKEWPHEARADDANPFAGVKAEDARCRHGFCGCDLVDCDRNAAFPHGDYCEACDEEHRAKEEADDSIRRENLATGVARDD